MDSRTTSPDPSASRVAQAILWTSGVAASILGIVVVGGWYAHSESLIRMHPSLPCMQFNTALAFAICGASLVLGQAKRRRPARFCGALAGLLGLLTLFQHLVGVDWGIDQLFIHDYIQGGASQPGRMAPNTALCFTLSGAALFAMHAAIRTRRQALVLRLAGAMVLLLGWFSILGYLIGVESAYGWGSLTRMAMHTAIGFVLVASGLLIAGEVEVRTRSDSELDKAGPERHLRQIIAAGAMTLAGVGLTVGLIAIYVLSQDAYARELARLDSVATSWVSLASAAAHADELQKAADHPGDAAEAILAQMRKAQDTALHPSGTGEILIVQRRENNIAFLLPRRFAPNELQATIPYESHLAEPARRVLAGHSGTLIGPDYRGETVLAAYRPVGIHNWGLLVKVDRAQIRKPFIRTAMLLAGATALLILLGCWLLLTTATPLANHLTARQNDLVRAYDAIQLEAERRRQAEAELRQQHEQLVSVFDAIDEPIYIADPESYELLYLNTPAKQIWGDGLGKKCHHVLQNRDTPCEFCTNDPVFADLAGVPYKWEFQNQINHRWYRCVDKAIRWPDGRRVRFEMATDITEHREAQDQLQKKDRILAATNRILSSGLRCDTDRDLVHSCLEVAREISGAEFGLVGEMDESGQLAVLATACAPWAAQPISASDAAGLTAQTAVQGFLRIPLVEGKTQRTDATEPDDELKGAFGGRLPLTALMCVPLMQGEKPSGVIALANKPDGFDADDQDCLEALTVPFVEALSSKRAEIALNAARANLEDDVRERTAELQRSNEELQQFAYVASHDLQEPLRMVTSFLQLLQQRYQEQLDEDANTFINYAVDGASRMQQLISDLLRLSRVGTQGKPPENVSAESVLERVTDNMRVAIKESDAQITHDPLPVVQADASQFGRLLQNLIGNAIKFCKSQPPHIHLGATDLGDSWQFTVRDNGIGIAPEHAERIFRVFQRLHTREEYPGTGMGLAICRKIVERHGGRIWVEASAGEGATFCFTLRKATTTIPQGPGPLAQTMTNSEPASPNS